MPAPASRRGAWERATSRQRSGVSKDSVARAAKLRHVSISNDVRTVVVAQAQRELSAARQRVIALTADEQLAFWQALDEPARLTEAQHALGALMRGE